MNGFDQPSEHVRPPWKTIAVIAGAAALAVAIIVAAILFVRARRGVSIDEQNLARVETQLEQAIEGCAQEADPEACRASKIQTAAEATGAASLCAQLEGETRDDCVWAIARSSDDPETCELIENDDSAAQCADDLWIARAVSATDASLCANIGDETRRARCEAQTGTTSCSDPERPETYCADVALAEQAIQSGNQETCDQVGDEGLRTDCRERTAGSDPDADGLTNEEEEAYGTDPANADTDADGYSDGSEVQNGYNPNGPGML